MSRTAKANDLSLGSISLLGTFLVAVIFFGAAVVGGFLAGYQRGFVDQTFGSSAAGLSLISTILGDRPAAAPVRTAGTESSTPSPQPARQPSPSDLPADSVIHPSPSGSASGPIGKSLHIQVSAGPDLRGAQRQADKLAAKGYPAAVYSGAADGLHRVILGPYRDRAAANDIRKQLKADGLQSLIRVN